jgi:hypothetical protein
MSTRGWFILAAVALGLTFWAGGIYWSLHEVPR